MEHLLLGCVFSQEVWALCLARFHLQGLVQLREMNAMVWWTTSRRQLPKDIRRAFDSLFFLVGWMVWKERNDRTFSDRTRTPAALFQAIQDELTLWMAAGFRRLAVLLARSQVN